MPARTDPASQQNPEPDADARLGSMLEHHRRHLAAAGVGTWEWDIRTNVVTFHGNLEHSYGLDQAQRVTTFEVFMERVHPADRERLTADVQASVTQGEPYASEFRVVWPDGTIRWLDARGGGVFGPDGKMIQMLGVTVDITDRRQAEETVRASEESMRAMAESNPHVIWTSLPNGNLDYCTKNWLEYTGFTYEEAMDWGWRQTPHPEDLPRMYEAWVNALETGGKYEVVHRVRRHDGEYRWFESSAVPHHDSEGNIVKWYGITQDIHDRVIAENALRHSDERFRTVTKATSDAIYDWNVKLDLVWWNENLTSVFGHEMRKVRLTSDWAFEQVHPDDRERVRTDLFAAFASNLSTWRDEYRFRKGDGSYAHVLDRCYMVRDEGGAVTRVIGAVQDMSAAKEASAQIEAMNAELERRVEERTRELEEAYRELEAFTQTVSHDLRSPIRTIASTSMILLEDYSESLLPEQKTLLERQKMAAARLGDLISDLLLLSRLGKAEVRRVDCDLGEIAAEVATEISRRKMGEGIEFDIQRPPKAKGDPDLLRLVLINLLENACKFSPGGGKVTFALEGDRFVIRDQGIGFDPLYSEKLFRPFERLVRQDEFPGTGIGLANVKRIVERHGGLVGCEGKVSHGATFWFTLPSTSTTEE